MPYIVSKRSAPPPSPPILKRPLLQHTHTHTHTHTHSKFSFFKDGFLSDQSWLPTFTLAMGEMMVVPVRSCVI